MFVEGLNGNYSLRLAYWIPTAGQDAYTEREWLKLPKQNCILTITDADKGLYKARAKKLRALGWKCLGRKPGAHGNYHCYIWGSKDFQVVVRKRK